MASEATTSPLGACCLVVLTLIAALISGCEDEDAEAPPPETTSQAPSMIGVDVPPELRPGREVAAQSGCLGCHRIGAEGNAGPGPNLTHVGRELSEAQIRRAIVSGPRFMPAYELPERKLDALVAFLVALD
ncbi:MAG TPA: cytochrome c [Solirubrobacterales bacterium]|nr:cytochrome c [Solirubrobacterales bacterium]